MDFDRWVRLVFPGIPLSLDDHKMLDQLARSGDLAANPRATWEISDDTLSNLHWARESRHE